MKLKRWHKHLRAVLLLLAFLALASLAIYGGRRAWTSTTVELTPLTMALQPQDFTLKISANGELQSEESMAVGVPPVPVHRLRIASVVPDGRQVQKGDVLVEFDPAELDLQALEHRSSLEAANQKINKGELAIGVEKSDIIKDKKIAELELQKINEFLPRDEQIYSQRQMIEGQLDRDFTAKKIVFADARLQLKGKVYSLDEAILLLERQQANAKIGQIEKALTSLKLLAPASGIVVYNDPGFFFGGYTLMPGRVVWIGMMLFNLVNPEKMEAKCFVLEKDAGELRAGQAVTVKLDPFPDVTFTGKVKSIDKLARPIDRDSPVKYFQTIVSLDKTDTELMKPGVKLKATIAASNLKSVLVVPRSAIVKKDSEFLAYIQTGLRQFEPVPVKLGQGDQAQVVVTEGLQAGQVLALNPPDVKQDFGSRKAATPKAP
jgi:HlyD family secretion protein